MLIELVTSDGKVALGVCAIDHRPAAGDVFQVEGREWIVQPDAPRSRRETITGGLEPRQEWVTRFVVAPVAAAVERTLSQVAA